MTKASVNKACGTGRRIALGVISLARFRADGFQNFGATPEDFLTSLAPLVAFPLVGGALMLLGGGGLEVLADLLSAIVALLAPCVLSEALAHLWRRDAAWLRYAVAFNWCQWILPFLGAAMILASAVLLGLGLSETTAAVAVLLGLICYGMALHWFLARRGLGLSTSQAVLFVVLVNLGTGILAILPRLLAAADGSAT